MQLKNLLTRASLFMAFLCPLITSTISAQTAITYGDNFEAEISVAGEIDAYTFTAEANDVIYIRMRDEENVDSHLKLYAPSGSYLTNNWSDGGLAEIREYTLTESGIYTINAYDENHNDVGTYGFSLHKLNQPEYGMNLGTSMSLEGSIDQNAAINIYSFAGEAGDVLYSEFRAYTSAFEGKVYLYDGAGNRLQTSIKVGKRQVIGPLTLEETDNYTIAVIDRGGNDKDDYGFNFSLLNKHEGIEPFACSEGTLQSLTHPADRNFYTIDSKDALIHFVETRSNDVSLELTMEIFNDKGEQVYKLRKNNRLIRAVLDGAESSSYLIAIYDKNGNDYGEYGLQAHSFSAEPCQEMISCGTSEHTIDITNISASKAFIVQGVEGQTANIEINKVSGDFDPELRLYDMDGNVLIKKVGTVKTSLRQFQFPSTANYILVANDLNVNEIGTASIITTLETDMELTIPACYEAYYGMDEYNTTILKFEGDDTGLTYSWSTGATTASIEVSPMESDYYDVTITNADGCYKSYSTYVDVQDITCYDGETKVEVCYENLVGEEEQLCLSEAEAIAHLANPINTGSYIGACGFVYTCAPSSSGTLAEIDNTKSLFSEGVEIRSRSEDSNTITTSTIFPNPTAAVFHITNDSKESFLSLVILDMSGQKVHSTSGDLGQKISVDMNDFNAAPGLYYLRVETATSVQNHKLLYVK